MRTFALRALTLTGPAILFASMAIPAALADRTVESDSAWAMERQAEPSRSQQEPSFRALPQHIASRNAIVAVSAARVPPAPDAASIAPSADLMASRQVIARINPLMHTLDRGLSCVEARNRNVGLRTRLAFTKIASDEQRREPAPVVIQSIVVNVNLGGLGW